MRTAPTLSADGNAGKVDNNPWLRLVCSWLRFGELLRPRAVLPVFRSFGASGRPQAAGQRLGAGHARACSRVRQDAAADDDVVRFSTYVRQGAIRFYLPLDVALPNDFFAQSVVITKGLKERDQVRARLEQALAERLPAAVARIYPLELGPPVGWPVKYRVSGPDPARVHNIALRVAEQMEAITGMRHINFDWAEPARVMRLRIDQDQARELGLSSQDVSLALNGIVSGTTITQVRNSIYLINVDMRAEHTQRTSLELIRSLQISLRDGNVVPLRQIASFEYTQEYPIVWRRDRIPTLTVQADVVPSLLPATAVQAAAQHRPARGVTAERLPDRGRWICQRVQRRRRP